MMATDKKIRVEVIPPCISFNREMQYVDDAIRRYHNGSLIDGKIVVAKESEDEVLLHYYR